MPYEFPLTPSNAESPPCCFDGTLEKFLGFDTVGARGSELVFCRGNRPRPAASSTWEMLLLGFASIGFMAYRYFENVESLLFQN
jgi:hypothetical protein